MLAKLFYSQLPIWARPTHPMMRYSLGYGEAHKRGYWLRRFLQAVIIVLAFSWGYIYASVNNQADLSFRTVMYYPMVMMQIITQLLAIVFTVNAVALERQKGTWESLQITLVGASEAIRTQWVLVFYRLRWLLIPLLLFRLGYLALLINDTTDFEGRALDVRVIGVTPEVSLEVAIFLLAALMTAAVLQPFVTLALDAAIGIFVGSVLQRRNIGILTTVILMMLRIIISISALFIGNEIITSTGTQPDIVDMPAAEAWTRTLMLSLQGDQGLRLLNLEMLGNLWADLENGIYIGGIMLGGVVVMAIIANLLVLFAAWRAGKPGRA